MTPLADVFKRAADLIEPPGLAVKRDKLLSYARTFADIASRGRNADRVALHNERDEVVAAAAEYGRAWNQWRNTERTDHDA